MWGKKTCPDMSPVADLDLKSYTGTWYEITRDKDNPFERLASCVVVDYLYDEGDSQIVVMNYGYQFNTGWSQNEGRAEPIGNGLKLKLEQIPDIV